MQRRMGQFGEKILSMQKFFPNFKKSQNGQSTVSSCIMAKRISSIEEKLKHICYERAKPKNPIPNVNYKRYFSFEFEGVQYNIDDTVLVSPVKFEKPYVAIIKAITEDENGNTIVVGQWFYRPEEAEKKKGGWWKQRDSRELFYSFHFDDFPAECIMHHCIVHFIPWHKQLPDCEVHPGFIVQRVYDFNMRELWELTDSYCDNHIHEINVLLQKTQQRLGGFSDIVPANSSSHQGGPQKRKRNLKRKKMLPKNELNELREVGTQAMSISDVSPYHVILARYKVLTNDTYRNKWLEKLLQRIESVYFSDGVVPAKDKQKVGDKKGWLDVAISIIVSLERAIYETFMDHHKYNQKMRQLDFNLKTNALLGIRLLDKELDPEAILTMSPEELKVGMTADEIAMIEPEDDFEQMQMTDAHCPQCTGKNVGIAKYIQATGHGDRYQLECVDCGHSWYADRDAIF